VRKFILKSRNPQGSQKGILPFKASILVAIGSTVLLACHAQAQTIYRAVEPDGRVTFSDKVPPASAKATALDAGGRLVGTTDAALPFELQQVASKYPVTLYTSSNCSPCGSGRALLSSRGIPFAEKTVTTSEDTDALKRISGESSLPFLTLGGQQIKGYSDSEWTQFLNAAGYPQNSALPASYRNPLATPLVAIQKSVPVARSEESQRAPEQASRPAADNAANPAGIKF